MSLQLEDESKCNIKQLKRINFGTDLAADLWITICNYLEPFDRFRLCGCCHDLNNLLCISQYPFYSFYKSDIKYWVNNIECSNVVKIKTKRSKDLPKYAFNFYDFDSIPSNILLSIKYYIIFYDRISNISYNKKIEKIQHLLSLQYASEHIMARLSDDEYLNDNVSMFDISNDNGNGQTESDESKLITAKLKQLDIDINTETNYLPTTIIHIYMHEISNNNQYLIHWICDILLKCNSNCNIFRDIHFDKSNLNNQSINYLCNALENRNTKFMRLRNLFFSGNYKINDECIERLLEVLYKQCPGLIYLNLDRTGITNKTCLTINKFYIKFLLLNSNNNNDKKQNGIVNNYNKLYDIIPKFEYIDLSNNDAIDIHGIDDLNGIFIKYSQFNIKHDLLNRNAIKLNLDIDVSNCNWSIARVTWSDHILYDD